MRLIKNKNFWKNAIVVVVMICIVVSFIWYIDNLQRQLENITTEKKSVEVQMDETLRDLESIKNELKTMREELSAAYDKIENQSKEIEDYKRLIEDEEYRWRKRYEEYPVATEVWTAMKTYGWNDTVCSGIMGNLMAETGGSGTFNLTWDSNTSSGYGLVQWTGARREAIKKKYGEFPTVKEQVQFIHDELYGTNGVTCQVEQYQLDAIMNAKTPEDCAYAFACYFERCDPAYREIRKEYARWAYNYFVL